MANYYARSDEPVRAYYARTRVRAYADEPRMPTLCARTDAAYGESTLVHSIGVIGVSSSEVAVEAVLRCVKSLCLIKPQMFISTEIINSSQYSNTW